MTVSCEPISIRLAEEPDVPRLIELLAAHADFERASFDRTDLADLAGRLRTTLVTGDRATCLAATTESEGIVGYTTFSLEYSTWVTRHHVVPVGGEVSHRDCTPTW